MEYSDPDVIVFLGDIFDEGSRATDDQYDATLARFKAIYPQTSYIKVIYL